MDICANPLDDETNWDTVIAKLKQTQIPGLVFSNFHAQFLAFGIKQLFFSVKYNARVKPLHQVESALDDLEMELGDYISSFNVQRVIGI